MSQSALPFYPAESLTYKKIRNRVSNMRKRHGVRQKVRIDYSKVTQFLCPTCKKFLPKSDFYVRDPLKGRYPIRPTCKNCLSGKLKVFKIIQKNICCVRCGCNNIRFLEINHKFGGGEKELNGYRVKGWEFYRNILQGKRKTDDLEILCRPCNAIHYLELKYNEQIPLTVHYQTNDWELEL